MDIVSPKRKLDVGVIIPAYNCADSIRRAIDSIKAQTWLPREVVIVNDGSQDDTAAVLDSLDEKEIGLKVIHQENGGPAAARNRGITEATTDWVAFLDSDDHWIPEKLERQFSLIEAHADLQWSAGRYEFVRGFDSSMTVIRLSKLTAGMTEQGTGVYDALAMLAESNSIWTGTVLAKRQRILELKGFEPSLFGGEDSDLWRRMAIQHRSIGYVTTSIAAYRVAQNESMTVSSGRQVEPSQFVHCERIKKELDASEDAHQSKLLASILEQKINGYLECLIKSGNTQQAKWFVSEIRRRQLPMPKLSHRIASFIPGTSIQILKSVRHYFSGGR